MKEMIKFADLVENKTEEMTLIVKCVTDKGTTTYGSTYVAVLLYDGIQEKNINLFKETVATLSAKDIKEGVIIKLDVIKNSKGYLNGTNYRLNDDPDITERDFYRMAPIDPYEFFERLQERVKSVDSNPEGVGPYKSISHLTKKILTDNKNAFIRSTAATNMHHNFLNGLIYHTGRMVETAIRLCDVYDELDRELLVCATALHDIGKISCYDTNDDGSSQVTIEGRLLDHAIVGSDMIKEAAERDVYHPEKIMLLRHMIAAHHGKLEWGAVVTPATPEAMMLNMIDLIDSRMNMFEQEYKTIEAGAMSEKRVYGLENDYIYKPIYPEL